MMTKLHLKTIANTGFRSTGFELAESGIFGSYKEMRAGVKLANSFPNVRSICTRGKENGKEM